MDGGFDTPCAPNAAGPCKDRDDGRSVRRLACFRKHVSRGWGVNDVRTARSLARLSVRNSSSVAIVVIFRRRPRTRNERAPRNSVSMRFGAGRAGPLAPGTGHTAPAQRRYVRRSTR